MVASIDVYLQHKEEIKAFLKGSKPNTISLNKYHECMGFQAEEDPTFTQKAALRPVCLHL